MPNFNENAQVIDNVLNQAQQNGENLVNLLPNLNVGPPGAEAFNLNPQPAGRILGVVAGKFKHAQLQHNNDVVKSVQQCVFLDPKNVAQSVIMQPNTTSAATQASNLLTETTGAIAQISPAEEIGKQLAQNHNIIPEVGAELGEFVGGFKAGFDLAEQGKRAKLVVDNTANSFNTTGIPKPGNLTLDGSLVEGPLKSNEAIALWLEGNPVNAAKNQIKNVKDQGSQLMQQGRQLIKVDPDKLRAKLSDRVRNQFMNPINPGQGVGIKPVKRSVRSSNLFGNSNNSTKSTSRDYIVNKINDIKGGHELKCSSSNYTLTIDCNQLEVESQFELLRTISKFKKRIILMLLIGSIICLVFMNRRSLTKSLAKFIAIYRKFLAKFSKFSNRRVFNNFFTKVIKRVFYVGYTLNRMSY